MRTQVSKIIVLLFIAAFGIQPSSATQPPCFWQQPGVRHLLDSMDFDMDIRDTLACRPIPRLLVSLMSDYESSGYSGVAAMVTDDDLLFSPISNPGCPTCICCGCSRRYEQPISVALPGVDPTQIKGIAIVGVRTIFTYSDHDTMFVRFAVNSGPMEVLVAEIGLLMLPPKIPGFVIKSSHRHTCTMANNGQRILGLSSMNDSGKVAVFGAGGLIRTLTIAETVTEVTCDVDTSDDIVCEGDGYAGSSDGSIYRIGGTGPIAEVGAALRTVSGAGAGGDDGLLAVHAGARWDVYDVGPMSIRHFDLLAGNRGREAIIVDRDFGLRQVVVYDSATSLTVASPPDLSAGLNGPVYNYAGRDTLKADFVLSDPEGNIEQPRIILHTPDSVRSLSTINGKHRDYNCDPSGFALKDPRFSIRATRDSLFFDASCLMMFPVPVVECNTQRCHVGPAPCSTSTFWRAGDTLTVSTGNDAIRILNNPAANISFDRGSGASPPVRHEIRRILATLQRGGAKTDPGNGLSLTIFDCQGRLIDGKTAVRLHPNGLYIARIDSKTGKQVWTLPAVR